MKNKLAFLVVLLALMLSISSSINSSALAVTDESRLAKEASPSNYWNGAFITQHGSWNRKDLAGYKVVFVPFKDGQPTGKMEEFLTGFSVESSSDSEVRGRPVGLAILADGSLLVSDDASNTIWRVSANR